MASWLDSQGSSIVIGGGDSGTILTCPPSSSPSSSSSSSLDRSASEKLGSDSEVSNNTRRFGLSPEDKRVSLIKDDEIEWKLSLLRDPQERLKAARLLLKSSSSLVFKLSELLSILF